MVKVGDAMTKVVLSVGPQQTIAEAARLMVSRGVGAAVVIDDSMPGPGIVTERDVLRAIASGSDPEETQVAEWMTFGARTATSGWDLDTAADEMVQHGFRHLLVLDDHGGLAGVVSMRDIVRARVGARPTTTTG